MSNTLATETKLFGGVFEGRSVLVTGHTGFKGSWLSQWLLRLGSEVHGYALDPRPHEKLFDQLGLAQQMSTDIRGDVRDTKMLREIVGHIKPNVVLHLAAQPLVRLSFEEPLETFETNVMGTASLLDAVRHLDSPCAVVIVTTDKCYENREWMHAYREEDAMGGYDPYSASKGCAELVTSAYRRSFFGSSSPHRVASARAGNVIGGGDWAIDRIVPDIFRAVFAGDKVPVRNRHATRPWQHVLEPLSGYLALAAQLADNKVDRDTFCSAFNFGPSLDSNRTVADVVQSTLEHTGGDWEDQSDPNAVHEASKLNLSIDRAHHLLGWKPVWDFHQTIRETAHWYLKDREAANTTELTIEQISRYESHASKAATAWAV